jgi:glucosamine-6-phosphate deaminase
MCFNFAKVDNLEVKIFQGRKDMGFAAARDVKEKIRELLLVKKEIRIVFAAAVSQNELLAGLSQPDYLPWGQITAFHMDEYLGLDCAAPQLFSKFLQNAIFNNKNFKTVHLINPKPDDPEKECARYSELLSEEKIDIVCLGFGENGHIAFNDPPFADFKDSKLVKTVSLDMKSRIQQVHDGCFNSVEEVPQQAISLTIPALFNADCMFAVVPGKSKAQAVSSALLNEVSESCPASILRRHKNASLYLDEDSAAVYLKSVVNA